MEQLDQMVEDYQRVEKALGFLEERFRDQPSLAEISDSVGLSEFHFQKLFSRWVGISPKRFLQFITKEYAKEQLSRSKNVLDVTYDAGLSSPGRLYDLFVNCEAITPGEYKEKGKGLKITYGFHPSPFGEFLVATTDRGICGLSFVKENRSKLKDSFCKQWKNAEVYENPDLTNSVASQIFSPIPRNRSEPLHLFVKGTNFQIKVWEALINIPYGTVVTYEDIAKSIGSPGAVRAVGTAIGKNPIPFLIPCHRVIRKMGEFGNYGEGPLRKKAILGWEAAKLESQDLAMV